MPSKGRITASRTNLCKELVSQWEYYVIQSRSLHKTFVSVKGVYFQAQVMGEQVTWIAPHPFTQGIPFTVDFRVMITFLDFYEVFMKFVLYKLYNLQGLQYPPVVSDELRKSGCHLYALKALSIDQETNTTTTIIQEAISIPSSNKEKSDITQMEQEIEDIAEDDESVDEEEAELVKENLGDAFSLLHGSINREEMDEGEEVLRSKFGTLSGNEQEDKRQNLFRGMKFFINREVNLEWMQVCICAMGGLVGWEGPQSPYDINCPDITHHVIDRPAVNNGTVKLVSREYIQPQWVFDCINAQMILPVLKYSMGSTLPPHLSPFVDDAKEGYLPKYRQEIMNLLNGEGSATGMEGQEQIEEDVDGEVESDEVEEEDNEEVEGNEENESDEEEDSDAESESEEVDLDDQKKQKGQKAVVVPRKAGNVSIHCILFHVHICIYKISWIEIFRP